MPLRKADRRHLCQPAGMAVADTRRGAFGPRVCLPFRAAGAISNARTRDWRRTGENPPEEPRNLSPFSFVLFQKNPLFDFRQRAQRPRRRRTAPRELRPAGLLATGDGLRQDRMNQVWLRVLRHHRDLRARLIRIASRRIRDRREHTARGRGVWGEDPRFRSAHTKSSACWGEGAWAKYSSPTTRGWTAR